MDKSTTIRIKPETLKRLREYKAWRIGKTGDTKTTYDDVIAWLLDRAEWRVK